MFEHRGLETVYPTGTMLTRADARAIGAVTAMTSRAGGNSWTRLERHTPRGIAPGTENESDGTPTVKVTYADGTTEVRTVSSFRNKKERRRTAKVAEAVAAPETTKFDTIDQRDRHYE
jgi:hypothetical protein